MPASVSPVTSVPCEPPSIKERLRVLYVTYLNISTSVFCARAFCSTCGGEQGQAVIDQRRVVSHGGRARISVALSVTSHSCHLRHQGERQDCHKSTLCWTLVLLWQQLARLGWIEVTRSTLCLSLVTLQALGHHNAQQTSAIPLHYVKLHFVWSAPWTAFCFRHPCSYRVQTKSLKNYIVYNNSLWQLKLGQFVCQTITCVRQVRFDPYLLSSMRHQVLSNLILWMINICSPYYYKIFVWRILHSIVKKNDLLVVASISCLHYGTMPLFGVRRANRRRDIVPPHRHVVYLNPRAMMQHSARILHTHTQLQYLKSQ